MFFVQGERRTIEGGLHWRDGFGWRFSCYLLNVFQIFYVLEFVLVFQFKNSESTGPFKFHFCIEKKIKSKKLGDARSLLVHVLHSFGVENATYTNEIRMLCYT